MPTRSKAKTRHSLDDRQPLLPTTYTWWTRLEKLTTMTKRIQLRINLLRDSPSASFLNTALSHDVPKTAVLAPEKNNTPDDAENNEDPVKVTSKQGERENRHVSLDEQAIHEDSEDSNYLPLSEDEESLGNEDFIVPEEPLEQERFKRRLIATARSLKKKQQQLQADQDLLNDRWTKSWPPRNTALVAQPKITRSENCYLSSVMSRRSPYHHPIMRLIDHNAVTTERNSS